MDNLKPTLAKTLRFLQEKLEKAYPDVSSQDLLALVLLTTPVQESIERQAKIIYSLLDEEDGGTGNKKEEA